jgi:hypothetical protein
MDDTPTDRQPPQPGKLTCRACGRTVDCPPEVLAGCIRTRKYPECCGQAMAYYVPAGKPWEPRRR